MDNENKNLNQNEEVNQTNEVTSDKKSIKEKIIKIGKLTGKVLVGALATVGVAAVAVTAYDKLHTQQDETDYLQKLEEEYPEQNLLPEESNREAE